MKPKTLWLVAPPKTGSTWISQLLRKSLGWQTFSLLPRGMGLRAQEIIIPKDFETCEKHVFLPHHHTTASEPTVEFIRTFEVRVILLQRNIFDTCVSLIDHLTQDGIKVPIGHMPPAFRTLPFAQQAEIVSNIMMPWYITFYTSWMYAQSEHKFPLYVLQYEHLLAQPVRMLAQCLTFADEMRNINVYNTALSGTKKEETRFNAGTIGRGKKLLPAECIRHLSSLCTYHKDELSQRILKGLLYEDTTSTISVGATADRPSHAPQAIMVSEDAPKDASRSFTPSIQAFTPSI